MPHWIVLTPSAECFSLPFSLSPWIENLCVCRTLTNKSAVRFNRLQTRMRAPPFIQRVTNRFPSLSQPSLLGASSLFSSARRALRN